uniref:Uncharacterized protein n=1 Tax=Schistosoma haematobium TaxID=6185 RepID=A0A095C613_SCHHA
MHPKLEHINKREHLKLMQNSNYDPTSLENCDFHVSFNNDHEDDQRKWVWRIC